jgi:hypothetical protein
MRIRNTAPRFKPKKVLTQVSYRLPAPSWKTTHQGKTTSQGKMTPQGKTTPKGTKTAPLKKAGRKLKVVRKARGSVKYRTKFQCCGSGFGFRVLMTQKCGEKYS